MQGAAVRKKIGWPCEGQPIFEISVTTLSIIFQCFDFFLKNIFTKISLGYDLNSSKTWWRIILARNLYVPSVRSKEIWLKVIFIFDFGRILKNLTYNFQKSAFFHSVFFWKKISQQCRLTADFADCRTLIKTSLFFANTCLEYFPSRQNWQTEIVILLMPI